MHLGQRIAEARRNLDLSHETLADLTEIEAGKIKAMESGTLRVSSIALARVARSMDVPLSWFFDGLPGQEVFDTLSDKRSV